MKELVFIGYFPKHTTVKPDGLNAPVVREICSVSDCIAPGPDNWINRWLHNEMWVYNTRAEAAGVVPPGAQSEFRIHAYRLLPALFADGVQQSFEIPLTNAEPLPATYESLGFDIVSRSVGNNFECSPLSCCNMAQEMAANEFCLMSTLPLAIAAAVKFSTEEPEPGPYLVLEVLRDTTS